MKMVPTEVTETSTLSIHTPGNYPKEENTRYSQHGESLKTRLLDVFNTDFEIDEAMFEGVEKIYELLFCILSIEKRDFDEVA
jgi:hypothetical protein